MDNIKKTGNNKINKDGRIFSYIFAVMILILFIDAMWNFSVEFSEDKAVIIKETYVKVTPWLFELLKNETAILPLAEIFWSLEPSLKDKSMKYRYFWDELDITRRDVTEQEKQEVHQTIKNYIHNETNKVGFMVFTSGDKHATELLGKSLKNVGQKKFCEKTNFGLKEFKKFSFITPHSEWKSHMVICKVIGS